MEELIQTLDAQTALLYTSIVGAIIFFIKDGSKFIFELLKTVVHDWWNLKSKEMEVKYETRIAKLNAVSQKEVEKIVNETPLVKDVIHLSNILKEARETLEASRITIFMYHNGMGKFFKNVSARHQDCRDIIDYNIENYQNKPLSPFYPIIEYSIDKDVMIFDKNSDFEILAYRIKKTNASFYVTFMIMVDEQELKEYHSVISIKTPSGKKIPIGYVGIELDEKSVDFNEQHQNFVKGLKQTIETMYRQTPELFG